MNDSNQFFFQYFEQRLEFIKKHCLDQIEGLILMCCCLDALGKYCYRSNDKFGNFRKFIITFSNQKDTWTKISLPLLKENFEKSNNSFYAEFIRKMGVNEQSYLLKGYNVDLPLKELEKKAEGLVITPFSDDLRGEILNFEYVKILWKKYRNYAIHELRSDPDEAANIFNETKTAYYNHQSLLNEDFKPIEEKINIGFPRPFIFETLSSSIRGFKAYVEINNIGLKY